MSTITIRQEEKIAYLTINREAKHNALTQDMWEQIVDCCDRLEKDLKPKVVVVTGAGDKAFSTGADILELREMIQDEQRLLANNTLVQQAQQRLERLPCATIAAINGLCFGGGLGIALACDFRLAASHAQFAITPAKLGLLYSIEDTRRLFNLVGLQRAKSMLYLGKKLDAQQACEWGLVNEVTDPAQLDTKTAALAADLLSASSDSIRGIKRTLHHISKLENSREEDVRELFSQAFSHDDFAEGALAFLEKRPADFK